MPHSQRKKTSILFSRRTALRAGAAIVGGYFVAGDAGWADEVDPEKLTPRQHGCLELPVVNPQWSNFEKADRSAVELALQMEEGTASSFAPAAAMCAADSFPGHKDGSPARCGLPKPRTPTAGRISRTIRSVSSS